MVLQKKSLFADHVPFIACIFEEHMSEVKDVATNMLNFEPGMHDDARVEATSQQLWGFNHVFGRSR